jgi:hypothetical protein
MERLARDYQSRMRLIQLLRRFGAAVRHLLRDRLAMPPPIAEEVCDIRLQG